MLDTYSTDPIIGTRKEDREKLRKNGVPWYLFRTWGPESGDEQSPAAAMESMMARFIGEPRD